MSTPITGNTYPVRQQLAALGGKWDASQKAWLVPDDKAEEARKLVSATSTQAQECKPFRQTKCVVCGVTQSFNSRGYPNVKIYKSGECQDCFEERKMGY